MAKFHNSDLWIAWMVIFCMEGEFRERKEAVKSVNDLDTHVSHGRSLEDAACRSCCRHASPLAHKYCIAEKISQLHGKENLGSF
ncbi:hypothetical protein EYF80_048437 [Liparis tanakae]|uniref:Uncharacterized protein n=1 Tax=Liparis tanakae TaxID=230148 RepID=A0A4Z2FKJ8_9TELE|nr:hypothetical protein EYF80_048437 [Liparis tanakae]